jgi:hypothetical protein
MPNSAVKPEGDLRVWLEETPKKPTTMSPAAAVVSEGATATLLLGVNAPLCESTGVDRSRPLKSRIAPAAVAVEGQDQR